MSLKNPVTPPGIDPGTVRLVTQRLNRYATPGPKNIKSLVILVIQSNKCLELSRSTKGILLNTFKLQ